MRLQSTATRKHTHANQSMERRVGNNVIRISGRWWCILLGDLTTANTQTYIATVEDDDMGDWIAQHRKEMSLRTLFYFLKNLTKLCLTLHIELDKWFGQPDHHLDDCELYSRSDDGACRLVSIVKVVRHLPQMDRGKDLRWRLLECW